MENITGKGSTPGAPAILMKGTINMGRSMDMAFIRVRMGQFIRDSGRKGNVTEKGFRSIQWGQVRRCGLRWATGKSMKLSLDLYMCLIIAEK